MDGWRASGMFITPPSANHPNGQSFPKASFAVDAGFYHDVHPIGSNRDSWVMFIWPEPSVYGPNEVDRIPQRPNSGFRIVANQQPFFTAFWVSNLNGHTYLNVTAKADAMDYASGQDLGTNTWTMSKEVTTPGTDMYGNSLGTIVDANGYAFCPWNVNGNGMVLKRMTSIAQQVGTVPQDIPTTCSYLKNVQWSNCRLAISANNGSQAPWGTNYGGAINYQFDPALRLQYVVQVNQVDNSNETDSIVIP